MDFTIGGIFFKRGEEVLLDLEDSHNFIHSEVETVRHAIGEFSQNLEYISHQQEALNQKNKEFMDVNTQMTETLSHINAGLETQKTDISVLREALKEVQNKAPALQPINMAPLTDNVPQVPKSNILQQSSQQSAVSTKTDLSSHEILNEEFDENEIPEFLGNNEEALLDLGEDFFIEGFSEEFSEETQKKHDIVAQSLNYQNTALEGEEFADVTDMLQSAESKNVLSKEVGETAHEKETSAEPVFKNEEFADTTNLEHNSINESRLEEEDFLQPKDMLEEEFISTISQQQYTQEKDDVITDEQINSQEEEFLDESEYLFADTNQKNKLEQEDGKQNMVKPISDFVKDMGKEKKPLPALNDLIPEELKVPSSHTASLAKKAELPSLDQILGQQHNDTSIIASEESMSLRADNIPAMHQKEMDQDVGAAIAALQEQAKMPDSNLGTSLEDNVILEQSSAPYKEELQSHYSPQQNKIPEQPEVAQPTEEVIAQDIVSSDFIASSESTISSPEITTGNPVIPPVGQSSVETFSKEQQSEPAQQIDTITPDFSTPETPAEDIIPDVVALDQETSSVSMKPVEQESAIASSFDEQATSQELSKELVFADSPPDDMIVTLRYALEHNAIDTCIRTILDPVTQNVCYLEGVNYLRDEFDHYHPPKTFEHAASKLGLDKTIDQILVTRIIQTVRALSNVGKALRIFTNISVKTLCDETFEEELLDMVQEKSNITQSIIFEITQKQLSYLNSVRLEKMKYLAECGFEFSLDHITQELPDLKELHILGFKFIKISPQILDIGINISGQTISVKELRQICASYDIKLIVEGVNSHNDLLLVMNHGADFVQGEMIAPLERLDQLNINIL